MIAQAGETYVLADHSKLGRTPFAHRTALDRPYTLITDSGATEVQLGEFRREQRQRRGRRSLRPRANHG